MSLEGGREGGRGGEGRGGEGEGRGGEGRGGDILTMFFIIIKCLHIIIWQVP